MWAATAHAAYHLERITGILNQPTYLTQAPGDPTNIIYYTTRISTALSGFNSLNTMGKVWRYDMTARTAVSVLDLSSRYVVNDDGLQTIAFHPDFDTPSTAGYGKLYVSSAEYVGPTNPLNTAVVPVDRVEEYYLDPTNPLAGASFVRTILQYTNNAQNNHTVDWVGFDPNATGEARNYLYISTGDSSYGNAYNGGVSPFGRPSQNPADVRGKILRVDVSGGDDYPDDPLRNFVVPPSNPIPTYTNRTGQALYGTNSSGGLLAFGEVYVTGVRNAYRVSFDRANSDMYWGDVGENSYEEVDFLKAGSNDAGPPVDYGWPQWEGTFPGISTAPHTPTNPFTSVVSLYPLREWSHAVGQAAIGGYVYRGPVAELQGKYFYADFVASRIWMLDFDRNTDPATFYGTNGILTDITSLWSALVIDPLDVNYRGDTNIATLNGIDHVVSFGEDNLGNLYVVDFGYGASFAGQYTANAGEIFKLVPGPAPGPPLYWTNQGTNLTFSWPGSFKLQAQTNSAGAGLGSNWIDYAGGGFSPVSVPLDTNANSAFFRLISK